VSAQGPPESHRRRGPFAARYGERPLHLAGYAAALALSGWAVVQVFDAIAGWRWALWFVGAILAHDLLLYPAYALVDRMAQRAGRRRADAINVVRVPALLSGLLALVWLPFLLGVSRGRYEAVTGRPQPDYLGRWLLITGALFAVALLAHAARRGRAARRA
jgi:MFS family permease